MKDLCIIVGTQQGERLGWVLSTETNKLMVPLTLSCVGGRKLSTNVVSGKGRGGGELVYKNHILL